MPSKFLSARFDRGDLTLLILLDDTQLIDGHPNETYVRQYVYGAPKRNSGESVSAYRARLRTFADKQIAEAKLVAQADPILAAPDPAGQVTLAEEGTTF